MRLNQKPGRRLALSVFLASTGTVLVGSQTSFAGGHGPIYRTLDAIAGGIEKVIDVARSPGKNVSGCDDFLCDDACDPMMLTELDSGTAMPPVSVPYQAPHPPMMPMQPSPHFDAMPMESMPIEAAPVERFDANPLPSSPPRSPRPAPSIKPAEPVPGPKAPEPLKPAEDDWLDSFSPEPPATTPQARRGLPTPPPAASSDKQPMAVPKRTLLRSPAETFDSLPDPFKDDQSNAQRRSANRQVGYWEPW